MSIQRRYVPPTRLDSEPFGTICCVVDDSDKKHHYIQLSHDENSDWMHINDFIGFVYNDKINDQDFINFCLETYLKKLEL